MFHLVDFQNDLEKHAYAAFILKGLSSLPNKRIPPSFQFLSGLKTRNQKTTCREKKSKLLPVITKISTLFRSKHLNKPNLELTEYLSFQ